MRAPWILFAAWIAVCAVATGCAITDYQLVTDNDQVSNGRGSGVVNTNGKAMILDCWGAATIWPDGTDQLFTMVDQKANGDRTLTTYNNFSTEDDPTFYYSQYCNPDWQGCSIITAPDPEVGDDDLWDYRANANCFGFRSFSIAYSTSRYYGECGRAAMTLQDRIALLNMGRIAERWGQEGLLYDLNGDSLTVLVDDGEGLRRTLRFSGEAEAFVVAPGRRFVLDARHPLLGNLGRDYADFLRDHRGGSTRLTVTYNGISKDFLLGPPAPDRDAAKVLSVVRRKY